MRRAPSSATKVEARSWNSSRSFVDERAQEFPRVAGRVLAQPHRYGYTAGVGGADDSWNFGNTYKYDYDVP